MEWGSRIQGGRIEVEKKEKRKGVGQETGSRIKKGEKGKNW